MKAAKRALTLALAAALCTGLAGCGQPAQSTPAPSEAPPKVTTFEAEGHWFKIPDDYSQESVDKFGKKLTKLQQTMLTPDNKVYVAVIPDKTELAAGDGPVLNSAPMLESIALHAPDARQIDLSGLLTLEDFYRTDGHWRQERTQPVLDALGAAMGFSVDLSTFTPNSRQGFVGAYSAEIPPQQHPQEEIVWLTSLATESASVVDYEGKASAVYALDRLDSEIPYDVYLSGANPLLTITCPDAETDRELVIFRDSFGSSLAPLLCGQYRTITLVDLRYMASGMIPQYLEFTDQDVLFLYSAAVVNRSTLLR